MQCRTSPELSAASLSQEKLFSSPPHKPFVAASLTRLLTCFGISRAEALCDSGWLRPPSKVATGQDSCKGGSEGFCLVPAAAGSGHSSPGGWRGLNHRTASVLIRNAGKRLVPFRKKRPLIPTPPFFPGSMGRGIDNYLLVPLHGDSAICPHLSDCSWKVHLLQNVFLGAEVPPISSLCVFSPRTPPSSVTSVRRCSCSTVAFRPWTSQAAPFCTSPVDAGASPATLCSRSSNWEKMSMPFCFPDHCFPVSYPSALFLG